MSAHRAFYGALGVLAAVTVATVGMSHAVYALVLAGWVVTGAIVIGVARRQGREEGYEQARAALARHPVGRHRRGVSS